MKKALVLILMAAISVFTSGATMRQTKDVTVDYTPIGVWMFCLAGWTNIGGVPLFCYSGMPQYWLETVEENGVIIRQALIVRGYND